MATVKRFEDLEVWQLARYQSNAFDWLVINTSLGKDFALRDQMSRSSGSVMDCIAEGFERSGNKELKNFLLIAKGSNGEFRAQLYRCVNRSHIDKEKFQELYDNNIMIGNKLMSFVNYLQQTDLKGHRYKSNE